MHNLLRACALALALSPLGGCAAVSNLWNVATGQTISPRAVVVAANAFDGLEATATNYLKLPTCSAQTTVLCKTQAGVNAIVPPVRAGRQARNQLEAYMLANPGQPAPVTPYQALETAVSSLTSLFTQYNAQK